MGCAQCTTWPSIRMDPLPLGVLPGGRRFPTPIWSSSLASLRRAGLVRSSRGAQGGYILSREPSQINIGEILNALEGSTSIADCVGDEGCGNACFCPSHPVFAKIQKSIDDVLSSMTLQDMIEENAKDTK